MAGLTHTVCTCREGYDIFGYKEGYDREGFDREGYDADGYNRCGLRLTTPTSMTEMAQRRVHAGQRYTWTCMCITPAVTVLHSTSLFKVHFMICSARSFGGCRWGLNRWGVKKEGFVRPHRAGVKG
jgi:hypothetical protein